MAHWLLQCNPAHWRVREFFDAGRTSTVWTVRRHRDRIAPGDDVGIWLSGRAGGVVAVGRVTGAPYYGEAAPADEKFWAGGHGREKERWLMPVHFDRVFLDTPITRDELKADERFAGSLIIRMPRGSNPFPVEAAEWPAVAERVPAPPAVMPWRDGDGHPQVVAATVRTAAAVVAAGATAVREAFRSLVP